MTDTNKRAVNKEPYRDLNLKCKPKSSGTANRLISVVTVVLNDIDNFETTVQSVISQTGCAVEYIVIDGGSTDGTLDIADRYRDRISHLKSEKDSGIYSAMNKGIEAATGDWIIFMNSGDRFHHPNAIHDVFSHVSVPADIIYGQYLVTYGNNTLRKVLPGKVEELWKGIMITSHQAMFIKTALMKANRFDGEFTSAGDHELVSKLYSLGFSFCPVPVIISVVSAGGVSDTKRRESLNECSKIAARYFKYKPFRVYFFFKQIDNVLRMMAKKIIPAHSVRQIQARMRNDA